MIISLDPSSTCIGWAVFNEDARDELVTFGRIKAPSKFSGRTPERLPWMAGELDTVLTRHRHVRRVVMEITSGKVARGGRARGMNGAGLGVYGMGVGVVWGWLLGRDYAVEPVLENVWTRGRSKDSRQLSVGQRHAHRGYHADDDDGGDISDAISLGEWWLVERKVSRVVEQQAQAGRKE